MTPQIALAGLAGCGVYGVFHLVPQFELAQLQSAKTPVVDLPPRVPAPVLPAPGFDGATKAGPRGDFVRELDALVGRVLDLLAELEIDEQTMVLLNADNGPETMHVAWMRQDHGHDPAGGDDRVAHRAGGEGTSCIRAGTGCPAGLRIPQTGR